jgi:hypothetical protein
MTVSVEDAQFLRSADQSWTWQRTFKRVRIYRVSGMFHGNRPIAAFPDTNVGTGVCETSSEAAHSGRHFREISMLYAILAYHVEAEVMSWTPEQDAAVMTDMVRVHDGLNEKKLLGPAARLGATGNARTLRGPGAGMLIDGPFAETKEQLLGFHVVDCADEDAALAVARDFRKVNPTAVYEIRPVAFYIPGKPLPTTEAPGGAA